MSTRRFTGEYAEDGKQRRSDCRAKAGVKPLDGSESWYAEQKTHPALAEPAKPEQDSGKWVSFTISGNPCAKPRMTRSDKWRKRPCVVKYRAWCDKARASAPALPEEPSEVQLIAFLPLPKSMSKKRKELLFGKPHRSKPDADNILKSIDGLFEEDRTIYKASIEKRWEDAQGPRVEVAVR